MNETQRSEAVRARFDELDLHDSRLVGLRLDRRAGDSGDSVDDVHLSLALLTGRYPDWSFRDARLTFLDCTYVRGDVDLGFKNVAGDAISSAECVGASALRAELERGVMAYEPDALRDYWEFVVYLCPPAGRLHVFARDFRLEERPA